MLTNLANARKVWGESSTQYQECRQMVEDLLQQVDGTETKDSNSSLDDIVAKLSSLAIEKQT